MDFAVVGFWRENARSPQARTLAEGFRVEIRPVGPPEMPGEAISPLRPRAHHGESRPKSRILAFRVSGVNMPGFSERGHSSRDAGTKSGQPEISGGVIPPLPPRGCRSESTPKSWILAVRGCGVDTPGYIERGHTRGGMSGINPASRSAGDARRGHPPRLRQEATGVKVCRNVRFFHYVVTA